MLTQDQAKKLVQSRLDSGTPEIGCEVAIVDSATLERPFGWVFFYQAKEYLLTGNSSLQLAGNAPLIINRHTGQVVSTGTSEPVGEYIVRDEASLVSGAT